MIEVTLKENDSIEWALKTFKRKIKKTPVLPISAGFDIGVDKFKTLIREAVEEASAA